MSRRTSKKPMGDVHSFRSCVMGVGRGGHWDVSVAKTENAGVDVQVQVTKLLAASPTLWSRPRIAFIEM